jgi:type I thyroxine 5'-deiodinase
MDDRCAAASLLQKKFNSGCPVLVDSMLDTGNIAYGATPIRLHVVRNGVLVYQGGPGPFQYDLDELRGWLMDFKKRP